MERQALGLYRPLLSRLALCALALMLPLGRAEASDPRLTSALARFTADSFAETEKAIAEIAGSGADTAPLILEALGSARLMRDEVGKSVLVKSPDGTFLDPETGKPVATPTGALQTVRVNNRLRRVIESELGSLTLMAADPAKRRQAAAAVFRSRNEAALPALESALAREQDPATRAALAEARAAILLAKADAPKAQRLEAIQAMKSRGDQEAIAALRSVAGTDPEVRRAAADAEDAIERRLRVLAQLQNVWYGLSLGSVLLLAAIGLAITFGVMGVINMAHGEMVMLGAYTTFVVQEVFRAYAPAAFDWSLPLAIPLAFVVAGVIGIAVERGIISFLYGRPLETLLATWGVSLVLQQAVRTIFGPTNREVGGPSYMTGSMELAGLQITYGRLWIIVFTLLVFCALLAILKATPLGLQMRAVTQNRRMASSMGICTPRVDALTFGLGSGIAGIAGVALSQIDNVSPNLGQSYIIDSFMVVVFGGVGNLWGTLVSALALGVANKFLEPIAGAVLGKIVILALLILFIQKRPRGLFALKGRAIEA
jgi:urea transport system permease protein